MKILLALLLLLPLQQPTVTYPIKIGILIPSEGSLVKAADASRAALQAYLDELNSQGGINGRKIELHVALVDKDEQTTAAKVHRLASEGQVVAFVGGIIAGREQEIGRLMRTEAVPLIGAATLYPPAELNPYVFYTLPGVREQARSMVNFAATKPELMKAPAVILSLDNALNKDSADEAEARAKKAGWVNVNRIALTNSTFKAPEVVSEIKRHGAQTVFVFSSPTEFKALIDETASAGLSLTFFSPTHAVQPDTFASLPATFKSKIFVSFPTSPSNITAVNEYRALQSKYQLPTTSVTAQLSTIAAAKIMLEGLRQGNAVPTDPSSGLNVKAVREQLIAGLEKLRDFNTGMTPLITFGKDRRIGSLGTYMVLVGPDTKQGSSLGFVSAN